MAVLPVDPRVPCDAASVGRLLLRVALLDPGVDQKRREVSVHTATDTRQNLTCQRGNVLTRAGHAPYNRSMAKRPYTVVCKDTDPSWLAMRSTGIGASSMAAAM